MRISNRVSIHLYSLSTHTHTNRLTNSSSKLQSITETCCWPKRKYFRYNLYDIILKSCFLLTNLMHFYRSLHERTHAHTHISHTHVRNDFIHIVSGWSKSAILLIWLFPYWPLGNLISSNYETKAYIIIIVRHSIHIFICTERRGAYFHWIWVENSILIEKWGNIGVWRFLISDFVSQSHKFSIWISKLQDLFGYMMLAAKFEFA